MHLSIFYFICESYFFINNQIHLCSSENIKRAFIIGLKYRDPQMQYSHNDCIKFRDILINQFDFANENITLWLDKNNDGPGVYINSANIRFELQALINISKPGDTLVFFFSGHGRKHHLSPRLNSLLLANGKFLLGNFSNTF